MIKIKDLMACVGDKARVKVRGKGDPKEGILTYNETLGYFSLKHGEEWPILGSGDVIEFCPYVGQKFEIE